MSDNLLDQERAIDELQRLVTHQIEEKRRLEDKAERIVRIFYGAVGIFITTLPFLPRFISRILGYLSNVSLDTLSRKIGSRVVELNGDFVVQVSLMFAFSAIMLAIASLFIQLPIRAYKLQQHTEFKPGPLSETPTSADAFEAVSFDDLKSEYHEVIEHNSQLLEESREAMDACYTNINIGILGVVAFTGASIPLLLESVILAIAAFTIGVALGLFSVYQFLETSVASVVFEIYFLADMAKLSLVMIFGLVIALSSRPDWFGVVAAIIILIATLVILAESIYLEFPKLRDMMLRDAILTVGNFFLVAFMAGLFEGSFIVSTNLLDIPAASFLGFLYILGILLFVLFARIVYTGLRLMRHVLENYTIAEVVDLALTSSLRELYGHIRWHVKNELQDPD